MHDSDGTSGSDFRCGDGFSVGVMNTSTFCRQVLQSRNAPNVETGSLMRRILLNIWKQ